MELTIHHDETEETTVLERVEYFETRKYDLGPSVYVERDGESERFENHVVGAGEVEA